MKIDGKQLDGTKPCKNPSWQRSCSQKTRLWVKIWGSSGSPGRPGSLPECLYFPINFRLRSKTGLERPPGGRRTAPDVHLAPPRHHFTSILDEFFVCFFTRARWETHSFLQGRFRDFLLFPRTFSLDSKLVVDFTDQSKILIFSVNLRLLYAFISVPHWINVFQHSASVAAAIHIYIYIYIYIHI